MDRSYLCAAKSIRVLKPVGFTTHSPAPTAATAQRYEQPVLLIILFRWFSIVLATHIMQPLSACSFHLFVSLVALLFRAVLMPFLHLMHRSATFYTPGKFGLLYSSRFALPAQYCAVYSPAIRCCKKCRGAGIKSLYHQLFIMRFKPLKCGFFLCPILSRIS